MTRGEDRRARLVPERCPMCGRKRDGEALERHLLHVHSATMVLLEAESGEQFWPILEPAQVTPR